jgi:hypothetical protein
MRTVLAPIALLAASRPVLADNPYANAGISDPAHVTQFVARLKQAVAADDRAAVAAMVNYPLTVNAAGGRSMTYRNAAALSANYARVFTPEVKAAIAAAKANDLFSRDQGVMIGNGEIWMNELHGAMKIVTVNQTRMSEDSSAMAPSSGPSPEGACLTTTGKTNASNLVAQCKAVSGVNKHCSANVSCTDIERQIVSGCEAARKTGRNYKEFCSNYPANLGLPDD